MTKSPSSKQTEREQRLSAALRANIKRRKQKTSTPSTPDKPLDQHGGENTSNENKVQNRDDLG